MQYRIRVSARGWSCSPLGGPAVNFPAGDYDVPEQMSEFLADRCIRSGRGMRIKDKPAFDVGGEGPETFAPQRSRKMKGRAPENKTAP